MRKLAFAMLLGLPATSSQAQEWVVPVEVRCLRADYLPPADLAALGYDPNARGFHGTWGETFFLFVDQGDWVPQVWEHQFPQSRLDFDEIVWGCRNFEDLRILGLRQSNGAVFAYTLSSIEPREDYVVAE